MDINVLLDDSQVRRICRFRFDGENKSIGVPKPNLGEVTFPIDSLNDIYGLKDTLRERVSFLLSKFGS